MRRLLAEASSEVIEPSAGVTRERVRTLLMIIGVAVAAVMVFYASMLIVKSFLSPSLNVIIDPSDSRVTVSPTDVKGYITLINLHRDRSVVVLKVLVGEYECRVVSVIPVRGYARLSDGRVVVYPGSKVILVLDVPRGVLAGGLPIPVEVYCEGGVVKGAITLVQVVSG